MLLWSEAIALPRLVELGDLRLAIQVLLCSLASANAAVRSSRVDALAAFCRLFLSLV